MKIIFNTKKMVDEILNYQGTIIICGLSFRTREIINKYNLKSKITYIFDNNINLINTTYKTIPIINLQNLKKIESCLIVICGNNNRSFYSQIKDIQNSRIIIEKEKHLSLIENRTNLLPSDFVCNVEFPNYKKESSLDASHEFIPLLLKKLLYLNISTKTNVVYSNNNEYKKEKNTSHNSFLFSYHSYGKTVKNVIRWKEGYLSNMITFDKKGYSGWSSLCDEDIDALLQNISQKKADNYFDTLATKYIKNNLSKYYQPDKSDFIFPQEDFVFFPLQTLNDSVMQHSYMQPFKLIKQVIKILSKQNIPLVIKKHPRCQDKELDEYLNKQLKKGKIILFNGSIHEAIEKATTVYTINSGVGFESLLHLKPVVSFGKSDYMSMTKSVKVLDEIKQNPFYTLTTKQEKKMKKFIYYYIDKKCLFLDDEKRLSKVIDTFVIEYLNKDRVYDK